MSSQKRIGRWKRFEIAFAEGKWSRISPFQAKRSPTPDKTRDLGKIGENQPRKKEGRDERKEDPLNKKGGLGETGKDASRQPFDALDKTLEWESKLKSETELQLKKSLDLLSEEAEAAKKASRTSSPSLWEEARQKQKKGGKGKNDGRR